MDLILELRTKFSNKKSLVVDGSSAIKSSVLIPILKRNGNYQILFTKRTEDVEHHKGQISFPGGVKNLEDETVYDTATRESFEEIGLEKNNIEFLGILNEVVTPSNFHITPIVGFIKENQKFNYNKKEVSEIFEIEIDKFFDEKYLRTEERIIFDKPRIIYFYDVWHEPIWGATAYFVKQLVDLINE